MTVLFAWLLADFFAGIIHWAQDKLLLTETRFAWLNAVKADNDRHHDWPAGMVQSTLWENINTSVPYTTPAAILLWLCGAPTVVWLAVVFSGFGNAVHRFAHMPKGKVHFLIQGLQRLGLFISQEHHNGHHFASDGFMLPKKWATRRYCPMTSWLNPVLDRIRFWDFMFWVVHIG